MKTFFTTLLLAVFCLLSSNQVSAQKNSIRVLLAKNGFSWDTDIVSPSYFDKEKDLNGTTAVTKLGFKPGEKTTTTANVLNAITNLDYQPMSLKEALQFRDPINGFYAGMYVGKTTVFLGSSFQIRGKTYFPVLRWDEKTKKGSIKMTADPFCCEETNIVVKR